MMTVMDQLTTLSTTTLSYIYQFILFISLQSGHLYKLARVSQRNWKKRYFVLSPYSLAYYDSEKNKSSSKNPKGELQISNSDCSVVSDKYDSTYGYLFKFKNQYETVTLAAGSTIERKLWMKLLNATIDAASKLMLDM